MRCNIIFCRVSCPRLFIGIRVGELLAALWFVISAASAWAIGTTAPTWQPRETVTATLGDYLDSVGSDRSLAYDHHGNAGIAFFDGVSFDLRYARRVTGAGWFHVPIDTVGTVGTHPSLAYDRYERPAISYYDFTNSDLKYAHFNGTTWQVETVDSTGSVGTYTSLAFDLLGRPAIAYYDATNTSLKYIEDANGNFSLTDDVPVTVANAANEGQYASLVFDPLNRPMIAHYESTGGDLRFTVRDAGIGWVSNFVDSTGVTGPHASIAIDPDTGFPAIAYWDQTNQDLRYSAWNGASWVATTVEATGNVGAYASLAFDPADGNPAIAYQNTTTLDLKLAWHNGSAWQTQTVDAVGNVGFTASLAFNDYGSGFPSIAYFNDTLPGSLFFIDDPPAAAPEPASAILLAIGLGLAAGCCKRRQPSRRGAENAEKSV
jgi:hypothetical protein